MRQSCVKSVYSNGLSTQPWGTPVLKKKGEEVRMPVLTYCEQFVKKMSPTYLHSVIFNPWWCTLDHSLFGWMVFSVQLKSTKSIFVFVEWKVKLKSVWQLTANAANLSFPKLPNSVCCFKPIFDSVAALNSLLTPLYILKNITEGFFCSHQVKLSACRLSVSLRIGAVCHTADNFVYNCGNVLPLISMRHSTTMMVVFNCTWMLAN